MLQQFILLWTNWDLQVTGENKHMDTIELLEQLLVRVCILPTHMKVAWKGLREVKIAAKRYDMQMVRKLIILRMLSPFVFLSKFELTWSSFDSWRMGKEYGYVLVSMGFLEYPSSIIYFSKGLNFSWDVNHLLQELKNELYVKMETDRKQYMSSYGCVVFKLKPKYVPQH